MEQKTLFFIPDISGFTKFITETEISHSQHIIQELLELLVDANSLGLKVSEFEGDAIFFYREGDSPRINELAEQARKMFVNFHSHLRKYETYRLCQCGACKSANSLTLKFIAHYGSASSYTVKDHSKLIGKDVIVVHRLLKNSVGHDEYILISEDLLRAAGDVNTNGWFRLESGADSYDEIGKVTYSYSSLTPLLNEVVVEPPEDFKIPGALKMLEEEGLINAPMEDVYGVLIDIPLRTKWVEGIKEVKLDEKLPNYVGTYHRCITNGPTHDLITSDVHVTDNSMEFWETDRKKMVTCRYCAEKIDENSSRCIAEVHLKNSLLLKLMFRIMMKKKLRANLRACFRNLKQYCEENLDKPKEKLHHKELSAQQPQQA